MNASNIQEKTHFSDPAPRRRRFRRLLPAVFLAVFLAAVPVQAKQAVPKAELYRTELPGAGLTAAGLSGPGLPGVCLSGTELTEMSFSGTGLSAAEISGAKQPGSEMPGISFPKIELPETGFPKPDLSAFDGEAEKKKLREAVELLDKMGLTPEKLLERAWDAIRRPENKKKVGEAVEDLQERAEQLLGGGKKTDSDTKKVTEKIKKEAGKATEKAKEKVKEEADKAAEKVTETVKEEVGRAAEEMTEEINQAVEEAVKR